MAERETYQTRAQGKKGSIFHARVDITDAMDEFANGVANSRVLKGASVAAMKSKMLPQVIANYGGAMGGPKRITGAMSKSSASKVKGLWYKDKKIAVAVTGLRNKNESWHTIGSKAKKAHRMEKWHANLIAGGSEGMYRVAPGLTVRDPGGRGTILNEKAWRIHSGVEYKMNKAGTKRLSSIKVKRSPSRIAHLIEHGHRFASSFASKAGKSGKATAYGVIEKAQKARGRSTQSAMMHEVKKRATKQAARVAAKVGKTVADTHNMVG